MSEYYSVVWCLYQQDSLPGIGMALQTLFRGEFDCDLVQYLV